MTRSDQFSSALPSKLLLTPWTQGQDTAAGCRDRASSNMKLAETMSAASDRRAIRDNAASWTALALTLQRAEDDAGGAERSLAVLVSP
jgi:hypothetical protein